MVILDGRIKDLNVKIISWGKSPVEIQKLFAVLRK
jgi:hypothetical protein